MKTNTAPPFFSRRLHSLFAQRGLAWLFALFGLTPAHGANTFENTGSLAIARYAHTATLLPNGKLLVAGGYNGAWTASAELYNPATGTWASTGLLATARQHHTATLLPNGKVLVAGGFNINGASPLTSAELYDPATGTWSATGSLATSRRLHTATLLPNGKVLVAGGVTTGNGTVASAELYDPAANNGAGAWTTAASLATGRYGYTATLLPNGKVLVAGGLNNPVGYLTSAELYNPATDTWSATGPLANASRYNHTATLLPNGKVLVAGGNNGGYLTSAELYNSATGTWTTTGSFITARELHTATLLPDGKVLLAGGFNGSSVASAELYDPAANNGAGAWTATGSLATARYLHTATLLPNGKLFVAAGYNGSIYLTSAELYDPAAGTLAPTGSLATARGAHTATLLPNGKLLVAGGAGNSGTLTSAELYDPATGTWAATGSLAAARQNHTATLLPNGKVLVAGGADSNGALGSAELYDPATGSWTATAPLGAARYVHTATLLPNGKVLVAGGRGNLSLVPGAELYDATTGTWAATGSLATGRHYHTATLLPNGKVLAAGGSTITGTALASAELYNPTAGTWTATRSLNAREDHTATLLPNGKVLVVGGFGSSGVLAGTQLFDPAANGDFGGWTTAGSLNTARYDHTATLLPNGKVFVSWGYFVSIALTGELYEPGGGWSIIASSGGSREGRTSTLLPNGKVLVAGGSGTGSTADLYDPGLGFSGASQPVIGSASFHPSGKLVLTGTGFLGLSSASGGNGGQDSPTNYPVLQLRHLDNEQCVFLPYDPSANVSATSLRSLPVAAFAGHALATVFTNGIPSTSALVSFANIALEAPTGTRVANGSGTLAYATVTGQTKDLNITVRNTGNSDLTAIAASLSGPDAGLFTLVSTPPASLAAGASAAFILRFSPTSPGAKTATISIVSDDLDENPFTLALTGTILSFTVDTDGDGMNDAAESLMSALGFDWQVNQAALVNTYNTNANGAGYYSAAQIQALNVGARFLQRNPATGQFKLEIGMEKSTNVTNFVPFPFVAPQTTVNGQGKIEFLFTVPDNAAFFRLQPQ